MDLIAVLLQWFDYLTGFADHSEALSLEGWLISEGNEEITVTEIINYCIDHQDDVRINVVLSSFPTDLLEGRLLFPSPYTRHSGLDYINYSAEPSVVFERAYKPSEIFTIFDSYVQYFIEEHPGEFPIYYYLPRVGLDVALSPLLQRLSYQSMKYESVQSDPPPYTLFFPEFLLTILRVLVINSIL